MQGAVADEIISEQEWAEVESRLRSCLSDVGLTFTGFRDDGSYHVQIGSLSGAEANALLPECEAASGERWLNSLRRSVESNPDNVPDDELIVACLVRTGVVPPAYTEADYRRDVTDLSFPYLEGGGREQGFWGCNEDPSLGEASRAPATP